MASLTGRYSIASLKSDAMLIGFNVQVLFLEAGRAASDLTRTMLVKRTHVLSGSGVFACVEAPHSIFQPITFQELVSLLLVRSRDWSGWSSSSRL